MKPNEIIKEIMKLRGFSNQSLATKLGKSTASAVSNPLSRENGMRTDTFLEMVEAMDCEVIVKSTLKDKTEWKATNSSASEKSSEETADSSSHAEKKQGKIKLV